MSSRYAFSGAPSQIGHYCPICSPLRNGERIVAPGLSSVANPVANGEILQLFQ
jgi:hypothetical protein